MKINTCFYAYLVVVATVHARSLSPHWKRNSVKEFDEYPSMKLINNKERLNMQFDVQNGSECVQYCRSIHDCHAINVIKEHNGTSSCEFFASSEGRGKHSSHNKHGKRTVIQNGRPSRSDIYTKESKTYEYMNKDYNDFYIGRRHIFIPKITSRKTPTSFQKRRLLIRHVASSLRGHKRHFLPSSDKDDDDDDDDANKEQEEVPIDGNCKFPFIYDGVTRYHCQEGLNDPTQRWCSLTSNFDRDTKWKRCTPASHPKRKTIKIPEVDTGVDDDKPTDSKRSKKVKYTLIQNKWKKRWKGLVCMLKGNNSCAKTNSSFTLNDTKITHDNATDRDGVVGASLNTTSDSSTAAPPPAPMTEANVTENLVRSYDRIFKDEDLLKESNMTIAVANATSKRRKCVFKELCPKFYDDVSSESDGEIESTKKPVESSDKVIAKISKSSKDLLNTTIDSLLASLSTNNDSISVPEDVQSDSAAVPEVKHNDSSAVPEVQHIPNVPNIKFAENTTVSELPHEVDGDENNMGNFLNDMKNNAAKMEKEEEKNVETTLADDKLKVSNETVSEHTDKNEEVSPKEDEKTKAVSNDTVIENVEKNDETAQNEGEKSKTLSNETVSEKGEETVEAAPKDNEKPIKISNETLSEKADNNEETTPKDEGDSKTVENKTVGENADKNNLTSDESPTSEAPSEDESNPNTSQSSNSVPGAKNINIIIINNRNDSLDLDEIEKTISQSTSSSPFKQNETEEASLTNEANTNESKPKTYALHSDDSTSIMPDILAKHDINDENIAKINLTKEVKSNVSVPADHIDKDFHRIPNNKNSMKAMKERLGVGQSGIVEPPKPLTTLEIETKFNESRQYLSGDATNSAIITKPSHVSSSTLLFDSDVNTNGIEKKDNAVALPSLRKSGLVNMNYAPEEIEITTYGGNADKGEKCKFPFIYDGDTYFNCINLNRDKPWCSVTENYDRSPRWGYCSEEELAIGEDEQKHLQPLSNSNHNNNNNNNNNNNHSNNKNNNNKKAKKQEARVLSSAEEELISEHNGVNTFGGNANGAPCTIPFVYDGRTHMKCIEKEDGTSWCATQRNYDIRPTWGYCCDDEKC